VCQQAYCHVCSGSSGPDVPPLIIACTQQGLRQLVDAELSNAGVSGCNALGMVVEVDQLPGTPVPMFHLHLDHC
jgi:hypothetical protein